MEVDDAVDDALADEADLQADLHGEPPVENSAADQPMPRRPTP